MTESDVRRSYERLADELAIPLRLSWRVDDLTHLAGLLGDPDPQVREATVDGLVDLVGQDEAVRQAVMGLLDDPDPYVRQAAVRGVADLVGEHEAVRQALMGLLDDPDQQVRQATVGGLVGLVGEDERVLLSRDIDGIGPWWDPREVITTRHAVVSARRLATSEGDVRQKYHQIVEELGVQLLLEWGPKV
jgi:HEAT repeat protein